MSSPHLNNKQGEKFVPTVRQDEVLASVLDFDESLPEEVLKWDDSSQMEDDLSPQISNPKQGDDEFETLEKLFDGEKNLDQEMAGGQWKTLCFSLFKRHKILQSQLQSKNKEVDRLRNRALHVANSELKEQMERLDVLTNQLSQSYNRCDILEEELAYSRYSIIHQRHEISTLRRDWYELRTECRQVMDSTLSDFANKSKMIVDFVQNFQTKSDKNSKTDFKKEIHLKIREQVQIIDSLTYQIQELKDLHESLLKSNTFSSKDADKCQQAILQIQEQLHQSLASNQSLLHMTTNAESIDHSSLSCSSSTDYILEERFCQIQYINTQLLECCEDQLEFLNYTISLKDEVQDSTFHQQIFNLKERSESILEVVQEVMDATFQIDQSTATTKSLKARQKILNSASIIDEMTRKYLSSRKMCTKYLKKISKLKEQNQSLQAQVIKSGSENVNPNPSSERDAIEQISQLIGKIVDQTAHVEASQQSLVNQLAVNKSKSTSSHAELAHQIQYEQNRLKKLHQTLLESWKGKFNQVRNHEKLRKAYDKIHYLKGKLSKFECQEAARQSQMERMKLLLKDEQHALEIERICLQQHEVTWKERIQELEVELSNIRSSFRSTFNTPELKKLGPIQSKDNFIEFNKLQPSPTQATIKSTTQSSQEKSNVENSSVVELETQPHIEASKSHSVLRQLSLNQLNSSQATNNRLSQIPDLKKNRSTVTKDSNSAQYSTKKEILDQLSSNSLTNVPKDALNLRNKSKFVIYQDSP